MPDAMRPSSPKADRFLRQYPSFVYERAGLPDQPADCFNAKFNADILKRRSVLATAFVFGMIASGK